MIKNTKPCLLLFFMSLFFLQAYAQQDYYWVGGTGNWDDLSHWSDVSGGPFPSAAFANLPTALDNVFFNANSFNSPNDTVMVYSTVELHDMSWEDYSDTVTLFGPGGLFIHGSLQFCAKMRVKYQGDTRFLSAQDETITTNGSWIPASCFFFGNGTWHLQDDFIVTYSINLDKGSLITHSYDVTCSRFTSTSVYSRYLDLGDSYVTITAGNTGNTGENYAWDVRNTSTFTLVTGNHSQIHFFGTSINNFGSTMHAGIHLKYDLVHFHISPGKLLIADNIIVDADSSNYDVTFDGIGYILGDSSDIYNALFKGSQGFIDGNVNNYHDVLYWNDGYINGRKSNYNLVTVQGNGYIGNYSLIGRDVNNNLFNIVDIWRQGRVYGNYNIFTSLLFSTHPSSCGCAYCGPYETGELHANHNVVHHLLEFHRNGYIYGGANTIDSAYFYYDGWVLQGDNSFYDLNMRRISEYGCTCYSYHANTLTLQSGKTQSIEDDLTYFGTYHCQRSYLRSSDTLQTAYLSSDSVLTLDYMSIRDIEAQNPWSAPDSALRSEDLGGNVNWFFDAYIPLHPDTLLIDSVSPCHNSTNGSVQIIMTGGVGPYFYSVNWPYWQCEPTWSAGNVFGGFLLGSHVFYTHDSYGCRFDSSFVTPSPPVITLWQNTLLTHVSCNGANDGTITVYAQGGTGPLTYSLNNINFQDTNVFTGLAPNAVNTFYTVYIKDSVGCTSSFGNYVITQPAPLNLVVGGGDISINCHGDSTALLVAIATGGSAPYTYTFMGPTNVGSPYSNDTLVTTEDSLVVHAGIYRVKVVDSHGCEKLSGNIQRYEPPLILIEFSTGADDCFSNSGFWATANASGGSPPFTYQWSNGSTTQTITDLVPGDYVVTVTDDLDCTMIDTVSIKQLDDTIVVQDVLCFGGTTGWAIVQASGGTNTVTNPYTYAWSTGATTQMVFNLSEGWYHVTVTDGDGCEIYDSVRVNQPDTSVYLSFNSDSTLCNGMGGGWAEVIPHGGTPPYTYLWSTSATTDHIMDLNAGTYLVTVSDHNNCPQPGSITIYEPMPGVVSFTTGNIDCDIAGYWIKAYVNGGTPPFLYTWSPVTSSLDSVYGLMPGAYSVSVTDNKGCNYYGSTQILPLALQLSFKNVDCFGGNNGWASVAASGGTAPYTYLWKEHPSGLVIGTSDTINTLDTGTYVVIVTDFSNCSTTDTVVLTQPAGALQLSVTHTDLDCHGACNGTAGVIPNFGTSPYTSPQWSNGTGTFTGWSLNGLCAGTYTVSVTDANSCLAINTVILLQPPQVVITGINKQDPLCNAPGFFGSISITAQGGSGNLEYSIHGLSGPFQTSSNFNLLTAGTYTVIVKDASVVNCYSAPQTVSITPPAVLGLSLTGQGPSVNGGNDGFINATATGGTSPYQYLWSTGATTPNLSNLVAGTYTLTLTDNHGCPIIKSLTISQPDQMILTLDHTNVSCHDAADGSITAQVSGGIPPYHFQWDPGPSISNSTGIHTLTGLAPNTYALTVTDNSGVTRLGNRTITQPNPYSLAFHYTPNICDQTTSGFAKVFVSGNNPPYVFAWNAGFGTSTDSIYHLEAGTYTVSITDQKGCNTGQSLNIEYWSLPVAAFSADTACKGNPTHFLNASHGTPFPIDTSFWSFGDGNFAGIDFPSLDASHTYSLEGTYPVSLYVKDINGCRSATINQNVLVYPIPTAEFMVENACFGLATQFYDTSTNSMGLITQRTWIFGGEDTLINQLYPSYVFPAWGIDTVKLIVSNTIGCMDSVSHQVQVDSLPQPGFSYINEYCEEGLVLFANQSVANGSPLASYFWEFGNNFSSGNADPDFVFPVTDTTYQVTLTATSERACSASVTQAVYVSPPFTADFLHGQVCFGTYTVFRDTVLYPLGDSIVSWAWNFGDGSTSFDPNPSHLYANPGTYTVILYVEDANNCERFVYHHIVIDSIPEADFAFSIPCEQDTVFFTNLSSAHGSTLVSYYWEFGDPANPGAASSLAEPYYQYSTPGQYSVVLTVTDEKGCSHSQSRLVQVQAMPSANFSAAGACQSSPTQFNDLSQGAVSSWNWDFGVSTTTLDVSSLQHPQYTFAAAGTYTVRLIVKNANGCRDTTWKQVIVHPSPQADFHNTTYCQNETIQFIDFSTATGTSINQWSWNFGEPVSGFNNYATIQEPGHQYYQAGFYPVQLIVRDGFSCVDTIIKTVTVYPHPLAQFSAPAVCQGEATPLQDLSLPVHGSLSSWSWDFSDLSGSSLQHPLHLFPAAGVYQVQLVVGNAQGCYDTTSRPVLIHARPDASFTYTYPCVGSQSSFMDASVPNALFFTSWQWNFGEPASGFSNYSAYQNPAHAYGGPGTYTVSLIATNSNQCRDTATATVIVAAPPDAQFDYSLECRGTATAFSDLTTSTAGGIASWQWDFGDGSPFQYTQNPAHLYASAGTFYANLLVTDIHGCTRAKTRDIVVYPLPNPNFQVSPLCTDQAAYFTNYSNGAGAPIITYSWDFGDLLTQGDTSHQEHPSYVYPEPGPFTVLLSVTNSRGCTNQISQTLVIKERPVANFLHDTSTCVNNPVHFTDLSYSIENNISSWYWSFGDGQYSSQPNPIHSFSAAGTYFVQLIVETLSGCSNHVVLPVSIQPLPVVSFEYLHACLGSPVQFNSFVTGNNLPVLSWHWNFADGSTDSVQNPLHVFQAAGTYQVSLTVTDAKGCTTTLVQAVKVNPKPLASFVYTQNHCEETPVCFTDVSNTYSVPGLYRKWNFGDPVSGFNNFSNATQACHAFSDPGWYEVSLIITDTNYCSDTVTGQVLNKVHPLAAFASDTACLGDTTHFFNLSDGNGCPIDYYQWNFGDPPSLLQNSSTLSQPWHLFTDAGNFLVRLVIVDSLACPDTVYHSVFVRPNPIPAIHHGPLCQNDTILFQDVSTTANGSIISRLWEFPGNMYCQQADTSFCFPLAGAFPVSITVTDDFGCSAALEELIQVNVLPQVNFAASNECTGTATVFQDFSAAGIGTITSRTWRFGDTDSLATMALLVNHLYDTAGLYPVSLTIHNSEGCSSTRLDTIWVKPAPMPAFSFSPTSCFGDTTYFDGSLSQGNGAPIQWFQWNFGDIGPFNINTSSLLPAFRFSQPGDYTVNLSMGNALNCQQSISTIIHVNSLPIVNYIYDTACLGNPTHLTSTSYSPEGNLEQWQWGFPGSSFDSTASMAFTFPSHGAHLTSLLVTDEFGCSGIKHQYLFVDSLPVPSFTYNDTCVPGLTAGLVKFTDQSQGNGSQITSWDWRFNNLYQSMEADPVFFFYPFDSCYPVHLSVTNARGCRDSIKDTLCVKAPLVFDFLADPVCQGNSTQFNSFVLSPDGSMVSSWTWDFDDGSPLFTTTTSSFQYTFSQPGTYAVKLIAHYLQGCGDTLTREVTVWPLPEVAFTHSLPCLHNPVQFTNGSSGAAGLAAWNWTIDGTPTYSIPSPVHTFALPGLYQIGLEVTDANGCMNNLLYPLEVYPLPIVDFTPDTVCLGLATQFTSTSLAGSGNILSRQWVFGDGDSLTSPFNTEFHAYAQAGVYQATLIIVNTRGCLDSATRQVTVRPTPQAAFTVNDPVCFNQPAQFNSSASIANGGSLNYWYWQFNDPLVALQFDTSYQAHPQYIYSHPDTFAVQLVVKNTFGCYDTLTRALTIHPLPTPQFTFDTACFGNESHVASLSSSPNTLVNHWEWNFNNSGYQAGDSTASFLFPHWGFYPVGLRVTDENTCVNTLQQNVLVDSLPIPDFSYQDSCIGGVQAGLIHFNSLAQGNGSNILHHHWYFGQQYYSDSVNPYHVFIPPGQSYPVSLTVVNDRGCSDSITLPVYVQPEFNVGFTYTDTCFYSQVVFSAAASPPGTSVNQWNWHFGDNSQLTSAANEVQHYYQAPGTYVVTLSAVNASNCMDTAVHYVTVYPPPLAQFSSTYACCNDSTAFTDMSLPNSSALVSWHWYFGDPGAGAADTLVVYSSNTPVYHFYPMTDSLYYATLIVTNTMGCSDTIVNPVYRCPCIKAAFTYDNLACDSIPFAFYDHSTAGGNTQISEWNWDFGDGTPPLSLTAPFDTLYHLFSAPGQYLVKLTITAHLFGNTLYDSIIDTIWVHPTPRAGFLADCVCFGDTTHFVNTSTLSSGSMGHNWTLGDNTLPIQAFEPPPHRFSEYLLYLSTLVVTSDQGCRDTAVKEICLYPIPLPQFTADPLFDCGIPGQVTFTDQSSIDSGFLQSFTYQFGDGWTESYQNGNTTHQYNQPGTYSILFTVVSNHGCTDSLLKEDYYSLNRAPTAAFSFDPRQASVLDAFIRFTDQTFSMIPYQTFWDMGDSTKLLTVNPLYHYADTGTYTITLTVIDENNCVDSTSETLFIYPETAFFIPNAFSPDGNGINDVFGPLGAFIDPEDFLMVIYNRWGEEIYTSNNFFKPWDGKKNDEMCPVGVYTYYIRLKDIKGERYERQGSVLLLKKD